MPRDLPGFYYDAEKNRYFPIKGPIPGFSRSSSSSSSSSSTALKPTKAIKPCKKTGVRTSKLLQVRQIFGNIISSNKGKCNFKEEFRKTRVSHPKLWLFKWACCVEYCFVKLGTRLIGRERIENFLQKIIKPWL